MFGIQAADQIDVGFGHAVLLHTEELVTLFVETLLLEQLLY